MDSVEQEWRLQEYDRLDSVLSARNVYHISEQVEASQQCLQGADPFPHQEGNGSNALM